MGLAFNTREPDVGLPLHFSSGPVQLGGFHPLDDPRNNITFPSSVAELTPHLPGTRYVDQRGGGEYVYVKSTVAVALGNLVAPAANVALVSNDIIVASSTASKIVTTTGGWTAGAYAGDFFRAYTGTGLNQSARIVWNTANTLYLDRDLPTALDGTTDFYIFRPYTIALTAATANSICTGVGISTITGNNYFGWVQVAGYCPMVLSAAAITTALPVGASGTAGKADDLSITGGAIGCAMLAAGGADELIPVMLRKLC